MHYIERFCRPKEYNNNYLRFVGIFLPKFKILGGMECLKNPNFLYNME